MHARHPIFTRHMLRTLLAAFVFSVAGCKQEAPPPPKAKVEAPAEAQPAVAATSPECVGPSSSTPEETFEVAGKKYIRKGSTVSLDGSDSDDEYIVGQITDVKDHNPDNAANLRAILAWMKQQKVDAIAVTGDIGETQESIAQVLTDVASLGVPVLSVIGNRECRDHYTQALAAVSAQHKNVINMNAVRVFNTDDVSLVSLPGYHNRSYLHCAEGCAYSPSDVDALKGFAEQATGPVRVLLSHGAPQQSGDKGIDRIHESANVGDPALAKFLAQNPGLYPFGMFGNILEAGGYATNLAGTERIAADTFADGFYVNPGPADSVRWVMLDKSDSIGMAGLVKVKGKQASYSIKRLQPGEAKAAAALPVATAAK